VYRFQVNRRSLTIGIKPTIQTAIPIIFVIIKLFILGAVDINIVPGKRIN